VLCPVVSSGQCWFKTVLVFSARFFYQLTVLHHQFGAVLSRLYRDDCGLLLAFQSVNAALDPGGSSCSDSIHYVPVSYVYIRIILFLFCTVTVQTIHQNSVCRLHFPLLCTFQSTVIRSEESLIRRMQSIQNAAAWLITGTRRQEHSTTPVTLASSPSTSAV